MPVRIAIIMLAGAAANAAWPIPAGVEQESARDDVVRSWWFPDEMPAGSEIDYHLEFRTAWNGRAERESQGDFTLLIGVEPGKPGRTVRMKPPEEDEELGGIVSMWLRGLQFFNEKGLRVTEKDVWLRDAPLLRGPWRAGDRISFGSFIFFFRTFLSVTHVEVKAADPTHATLAFEFWGGEPLPTTSGRGELTLTSDDDGITKLRVKWKWNARQADMEGSVLLSRTRIRRSAAGSTDK